MNDQKKHYNNLMDGNSRPTFTKETRYNVEGLLRKTFLIILINM